MDGQIQKETKKEGGWKRERPRDGTLELAEERERDTDGCIDGKVASEESEIEGEIERLIEGERYMKDQRWSGPVLKERDIDSETDRDG